MRITENVHLIRKEFKVTPVVNRYVNIYLIEGQQGCYLIDSGVSGTEHLIDQYMKSIGKSIKDIKGLFLTHSHPDNIVDYPIEDGMLCRLEDGRFLLMKGDVEKSANRNRKITFTRIYISRL